jgi:hypothetical protein
MSWAAFLALLISAWGMRYDVHPWFEVQVPRIEFVNADEIGGYPVCGRVDLWHQFRPGEAEHRWVERIRLVRPDSVWWCPHEALPNFVDHELYCHVLPFILDGDDNSDHHRAGCGPVVILVKP